MKEWNFGSFEARDERLDPPVPYGDFFVKYGGESQDELSERIYRTITELMDQSDQDDKILIVSHGGAIANFIRKAGFDWKEFRAKYKFSNCSVIKLEYNDKKYKLIDVINEQ
ncbi:broad specificity phosphatase PhoE [Lactobacillus colini]|uniref:Broad specificity phosphatase PhoE n=1 Tax=Lactobacillus colini TaxID=1819254 RepID=A0ABS4MGC3_9LACO|nr:broad specificity phosphatase PhoE [Lactobacillus colini]